MLADRCSPFRIIFVDNIKKSGVLEHCNCQDSHRISNVNTKIYVLLTVLLSIILETDQLNAQILVL